NCGALSESLLDSELFGHEKGAFTGAVATRKGAFELADGGTLFLDEVGELPMETQAALLRVIEGKGFRRVGGTEMIQPDVRLVVATNRDLRGASSDGSFREDLYYRLEVIPLHLPPLRERREDIRLLVDHFMVKKCGEMNIPLKRLSAEAVKGLISYPWPGNVRELENLVRRLAALYPQDEISAEIIEQELRAAGALRASQSEALPEEATLTQAVEQHLQRYFAQFGDQLPPAGLYQRVLADVEQPLLIAALTATGGNQLKAADLLGLNRNTLRKKIRDYGINIYRGAG
ncbi:MAG: sigma-54 dependent transcriptional regulator, partial [Pseudomonadota bacterium]|nr:sigma-54 dependent transcriptional regulator [Pseudomonadota bacterium]